MRLHYLQHVPFEDPAQILAWAQARGCTVTSTRLDEGQPLPDPDAVDLLVVMGGPMNIYEEDRYPWLRAEKAFLAQAIAQKKRVLGVCLGAQLLADVLGGRVYANTQKEIGWYPVTMTPEAKDTPVFRGLPATFPAFHWHGDTFSMPPGSVHLATSAACANQAFVFAERVVGLQFHLESTQESITRLIRHCGDELVPGPSIQTAEAQLTNSGYLPQAHAVLHQLLENLMR